MTRHELLQEKYEDALFTLLMEEVAEAEGRKALDENERLKNDPTAAMSEELRKKCLRTIRHGYTRKKYRAAGKATMRIVSKVAIIVMVLMLSFTVAFAASPEVRSRTLHWMVERYDNHMEFRVEKEPTDDQEYEDGDNQEMKLIVNWVPEGFELMDSGQEEFSSWLLYQYGESSIYISTQDLDGNMISIDSEDTELQFAEVRGKPALILSKEAYQTIYIPISEYNGCVVIDGEWVTKEELFKVAENVYIG